jgi:RimJ/RimL family protein N-acetyltransferase
MSYMISESDQKNIYSSERIETVHIRGGIYRIHKGLSRDMVDTLRAYSLDIHDTELRKATSDYERFGLGSYEEWYAKGRIAYALIDDATDTLAALVWFGPKTLGRPSLKHLTPEEQATEHAHTQGDWHTVSYRAYGSFRGKGLMRTFVTYAMENYLHNNQGIRLWLSIDTENEASKIFAQKIGFLEDAQLSNPAVHHYVYTFAHHG